ncbi:hypothetical protein EV363DRAFT_392629 [Boletus edulis]|nr:hypothetical protein EV363DRAFT_392629 [Boletus edulis]
MDQRTLQPPRKRRSRQARKTRNDQTPTRRNRPHCARELPSPWHQTHHTNTTNSLQGHMCPPENPSHTKHSHEPGYNQAPGYSTHHTELPVPSDDRLLTDWRLLHQHPKLRNCSHCGRGTIESLDHILTECTVEENDIIWNLVQHAWPEANENWTKPTLGSIIGCGNLVLPHNEQGTNSPLEERGSARLKRILISESAYLLWTMRCDRVIGEHTHTRMAMTTKWRKAIMSRLDIDRRRAKSNRKNHTKAKVLHTWSTIIPHPESLPHDWITNLEVLVGIKLPRPD